MTPEDIAALRALMEKATPGPWAEVVWHGTDEGGWVAAGPHCDIRDDEDSDEPGCSAYEQAERDAALIVAMHNALPALLDLAAEALASRPVVDAAREWVERRSVYLASPDTDWRVSDALAGKMVQALEVLVDAVSALPKGEGR